MNDVFDRLLEHVLREELALARTAPDLTARVAAALPAATGARRVAARAVRPPRVRLAIAAAAAAAVVAVAWLTARPAALECSAPLLAAAAGETFAPRTHLADGTVVWCAGAAAVSLAAADGTVLAIAPNSACALAVAQRTAELLGGTLELRPRRAPWRVARAGIDVLVPDGAAVRCVLDPDVPAPSDPTDPNMNPNDLRELLRATTAAAIFTITVLDGTAELATAQGTDVVPAGQTRTVDASGNRAAAARAYDLYQQVRKDLPQPTDEAGMIACKELDERFHELATSVLRQPAAAAAIRVPLLKDLVDVRLPAEPRKRAIQLALLDDEPRLFGAVGRLWTTAPDAFQFEEQVALAERGFEPAQAKLREWLAEPRGALAAQATAALAFGGDTSVRASLQRFATRPVLVAERDLQVFDAVCQAKVALAVLGDGDAVSQLRAAIVKQGEAWLATGEPQKVALADSCAQRTRYYLQQARPRLSWLDLRVQAASGPRTGEPDAASVRAALREIAPK